MSYLQNRTWKDRPGAVAGVIVIHAAVGYALVTGLSFSTIVETVQNPQGIFVPDVELPPLPPPDPAAQPDEAVIDRPIVAPRPPIDVSPVKPVIDTTPIIIPLPDTIPYVVPHPTPSASVAARRAFDPVGAKPRGNPGSWVTVNDYRSSWINRGMTGTARFRLEIGTNGRVENCTITASSGYSELDKATCALVSQRAKFDPARDQAGANTTGSYTNSVRWELPE